MNYVNGSELKSGRRYRLIAKADGTIVNNTTEYLATNQVDKKDKRTVIELGSGVVAQATPTSIWSEV